MTSLSFYKFIEKHAVEWHWIKDKQDVVIFIPIYKIERFNELLPKGLYEDAGIVCNMKDGYFAFEISSILEYSDIDVKEVFADVDEP